MYHTLTVAREPKNGGGRSAAPVAERLPWELRISRRALWHGAFDALTALPRAAVFDAKTMALMARAASGMGIPL